jgi:hypothetical protein
VTKQVIDKKAQLQTYICEKVKRVLHHDGVTAGSDPVLKLLDHIFLTQVSPKELKEKVSNLR